MTNTEAQLFEEPFKYKDLKVYASTEWLAGNKKKYRQVLELKELSYVYAELTLINKNYEIDIKLAKDDIANPTGYDFYIFHNLPSAKYDIGSLLTTINSRKIPRLFIPGGQTDIPKFNKAQNTLQINGANVGQNEIQAVLKSDFSLFKLDNATKESIGQFVPLLSPYGTYTEGPNTSSLLFQKIGNVFYY